MLLTYYPRRERCVDGSVSSHPNKKSYRAGLLARYFADLLTDRYILHISPYGCPGTMFGMLGGVGAAPDPAGREPPDIGLPVMSPVSGMFGALGGRLTYRLKWPPLLQRVLFQEPH